MAKLPSVDGHTVIEVFRKVGFAVDRIHSSHHILVRHGHRFNLSVPVHGAKPVPNGTLAALIRASGLSRDEFIRLLDD